MHKVKHANDAVLWYMSDLTSRIIAESKIPSDRHHLGKMVLQGLKDAPDFVCQIDGATDEWETNSSVLQRSVRCAMSMRKYGLQHGDVIVLMAPSHKDLVIPYYAALYLGVIIAAVDRTLRINELQNTFRIDKPKLIFCQSERASDVQMTIESLGLEASIVTFDEEEGLRSFTMFLEEFGDDSSVDDFRPNDFDPEETVAFLIATSGTTGMPKAAAATHKNFAITGPYWWARLTNFPTPTRIAMVASPLQWLSAIYNFLFSPILRYTRLQSSLTITQEQAYYLINTYKPSFSIFSPTMFLTLTKPGDRDACDFTCFDLILLGGSAVPPSLIEEMKEISPETEVCNIYGMSELTGMAFQPDDAPPGSSGKPVGCFQYRIVNAETSEDVVEPNVPGELWLKGPGIFKEYYCNPEATEDTFAEDRWFKTGDIFYRDENWNFFFVERFKLLLKYKSHHISPVEVEGVIRQHPGVIDVAVTGIPDPECGDLTVACVMPHPDWTPDAQEIKELVRDSLADSKQLRGGVIFMSSIPMNASTKVDRRKLKEIVLDMERE